MKQITESIKKYNNPYLLFIPFLFIYITIAIIFFNVITIGDEERYISYSKNLLNGFYSPPPPNLVLTNAPGYPLILMPIFGLNLPSIVIALLNALFYYLSIILIYKGLQRIANFRISLLLSFFWASYINNYEFIPTVMTEIFTIFLMSLLVYCLIRTFDSNTVKPDRKFLVLSGLTFGYIILTKFIFGYVLILMFLATSILCIINKKSINYRKGILILTISFAVNVPYLIYTYNLTGKLFYWGSAGGDAIYWMSTPFEGEYGDWKSFVGSDWNKNNSFVINHQPDKDKLSINNQVKNDEILIQIAIKNIKSHPLKYLQNIGCNIGRLLFNYPFSYKNQSPRALLRIPHNAFLCVFLLISLIPTFLNWSKIPYSIRFMLFITLIYLGGSSLASANPRMFTVIVPILLIWIAFILQNIVKINLKLK